MTQSDDGGPPDEEEFKLSVEVPEHVRHDPVLLRQWLEAISAGLLNADRIKFDEDTVPSEADADAADWLSVTMMVRPCGGRFFSDDGDSQGEDDDGDPGDAGGGGGVQP